MNEGTHPFPERQLFERSPDPMFTLDLNGRILDANPALGRALDRPRDGLPGTEIARCFTDPEWAKSQFDRALANGGVTDVELSVRSPSGSERLFSINAAALHAPGGEVAGLVGTARDVTVQRELESRLRASQFYNRSIIEASPRGLIVVDPELVVRDVNEQSSQIIGFDRRELIGRPLDTVFELSASDRDRFQLTFTEGIRSEFELTVTPRAGGPKAVGVSATTFLEPGGEPRSVLAIDRP